MADIKEETIVPRNVEEEMKESYLRYSMSVIISRALPDVYRSYAGSSLYQES